MTADRETTKQTGGSLPPDVLPPDRDPRGGNAERHGILSEHVPPAEREAYTVHVQKVRESTGAAGYLQERLADRAALALWRLDRVARYEAALSSTAQRRALQEMSTGGTPYGPSGAAADLWTEAGTLTGLGREGARSNPDLALIRAAECDRQAAQFETWAAGGSADGLSDDDAAVLGYSLAAQLLDTDAAAGDMVRAMMGRAPRKGEAAQVEGDEWEYTPQELPALLTFARDFWGDTARFRLQVLAQVERTRGQKIRAAVEAAQAAEADALALAALPSPQALEKVTRYEAHLERVLYRALHDLEAARRESAGEAVPPPLRVSGDTPGPDLD